MERCLSNAPAGMAQGLLLTPIKPFRWTTVPVFIIYFILLVPLNLAAPTYGAARHDKTPGRRRRRGLEQVNPTTRPTWPSLIPSLFSCFEASCCQLLTTLYILLCIILYPFSFLVPHKPVFQGVGAPWGNCLPRDLYKRPDDPEAKEIIHIQYTGGTHKHECWTIFQQIVTLVRAGATNPIFALAPSTKTFADHGPPQANVDFDTEEYSYRPQPACIQYRDPGISAPDSVYNLPQLCPEPLRPSLNIRHWVWSPNPHIGRRHTGGREWEESGCICE